MSAIESSIFDEYNRIILQFLKEEKERKGEIYQWYERRYLAQEVGLSIIERRIVDFILERFGTSKQIVEIGAGVAQCSFLLAGHGVDVVPVESSHECFDMMTELAEKISTIDSKIKKHFKPIKGKYPMVVHEKSISANSIFMFPSLSFGQTEEEELQSMMSMKLSDGVIIGLTQHFRPRNSEEEKEELIKQVRELGFGEPIEIFSWNDSNFGFAPDRIVYLERTD
ncbi:hypothetical protein OAJ94_02460 [Deltaproteobacteria bacterium]|nr:hypothetical protein [Deltaproteobacteria bacterium]